ncbi:sugar ABC transporter substrate-binding protein [Arsenicitalea aurantiaca]|uniref:Sugar ABC transporter substrate-binding protein n=1 Tax=Arsenicitalea aurantiaca TaxID=1783274 RepID=A0A433XBC5_9HYPH|nr:substrate-binding domain-containing protein [Arsenicitalea aurantiaca]RUT31376.1 sugar ABC transporter substrate-binding protein [Arsenicitalea aurantiaca]
MAKTLLSRRLMLAALAGTSMVAAGFGLVGTAAAQEARIAAVVQSLDTEFNVLWADAANRHPLVEDGTIALTVLDGRMDALQQSNQFDTAIAEGYDAIIFVPVDINAGNDPVQRAMEAGIPVIGSNTLISDTDLYESYISSNDVEAGRILAESVIEKMGGSGNVVIVEGMIGQSAQVQRLEGIEEALAANPDVTVLEQRTANWSRAEALSLVENWLISRGGEINGIIAQNDEMAIGALEAVKAAGLDPAEVPVAGVDGVTDALLAVQRGEMMSTLQDADAQAQGAIDLAMAAIEGEGYEPRAAVWDVNGGEMAWDGGQSQQYSVPWVPVTADNVEDLLAMRQNQ